MYNLKFLLILVVSLIIFFVIQYPILERYNISSDDKDIVQLERLYDEYIITENPDVKNSIKAILQRRASESENVKPEILDAIQPK
jgi:hypothetical protein